MAAAKGRLIDQRKMPRAFYLSPDDMADFLATDPPRVNGFFKRKPSWELGFDGVPVRAREGAGASALMCNRGTAISVPVRLGTETGLGELASTPRAEPNFTAVPA